MLILDQDQSLPVADILKDTVSAMEYDFNIRLSILVGQVWTESKDRECLLSSGNQNRLSFSSLDSEGHQGVYRFFSTLPMGIEQAGWISILSKRTLASVGGVESIARHHCCSLGQWCSLLKAAQLYLTNSLQYKIDKWEGVDPGSSVEVSDRSSLCCHLVLQDIDLN